MKNILSLIIIASLIGICSCNISKTEENEIDKLEWLIGSWENVLEERELYEVWTKVNDSLLTAISFMMVYGDTVFSETMLLEQINNDLLLTPTTMNQNDGNPVTFKLISSENEKFIFENKEHDFPQRIVYSNPQPDSLYAYIEGEENGQYHKIDFIMNKSEDN